MNHIVKAFIKHAASCAGPNDYCPLCAGEKDKSGIPLKDKAPKDFTTNKETTNKDWKNLYKDVHPDDYVHRLKSILPSHVQQHLEKGDGKPPAPAPAHEPMHVREPGGKSHELKTGPSLKNHPSLVKHKEPSPGGKMPAFLQAQISIVDFLKTAANPNASPGPMGNGRPGQSIGMSSIPTQDTPAGVPNFPPDKQAQMERIVSMMRTQPQNTALHKRFNEMGGQPQHLPSVLRPLHREFLDNKDKPILSQEQQNKWYNTAAKEVEEFLKIAGDVIPFVRGR